MTQAALLFVRVPPVAPAIEREWTRWYDREHIAYRLSKPGFVGARRFHVEGGPVAHLALYELSDPSALTGDAYLAHRRWEEALQLPNFEAIAPRLPGFRRGVYRQQAPEGRAYVVPDCDTLLIVDLDSADALGDIASIGDFVAGLERVEGVRAARVLALESAVAPGSGQHTGGPQRLAMVDMEGIMPSLAETLGRAWTERVRPEIARVSTLARRAYSSFHPGSS